MINTGGDSSWNLMNLMCTLTVLVMVDCTSGGMESRVTNKVAIQHMSQLVCKFGLVGHTDVNIRHDQEDALGAPTRHVRDRRGHRTVAELATVACHQTVGAIERPKQESCVSSSCPAAVSRGRLHPCIPWLVRHSTVVRHAVLGDTI